MTVWKFGGYRPISDEEMAAANAAFSDEELSGLDHSGNVVEPTAWLAANPKAPKWLREMIESLQTWGALNCPTCGQNVTLD